MNVADEKKRCFDIIERFPQEQLGTLADSLEAMYRMLDEAMDEAFCAALSDRYAQREDKDEQGVPFEELVEELGFSLEDLKNANLED